MTDMEAGGGAGADHVPCRGALRLVLSVPLRRSMRSARPAAFDRHLSSGLGGRDVSSRAGRGGRRSYVKPLLIALSRSSVRTFSASLAHSAGIFDRSAAGAIPPCGGLCSGNHCACRSSGPMAGGCGAMIVLPAGWGRSDVSRHCSQQQTSRKTGHHRACHSSRSTPRRSCGSASR